MVLAYHLILTTYGFWLPNDPRGSYSDFVRSFDLYHAAGKATKVSTHRSVANKPLNHAARQNAKQALTHPPVVFTGQQARAVALGFADYCTRNQRTCFACAVMPNHAHLVLQRTDLSIENKPSSSRPAPPHSSTSKTSTPSTHRIAGGLRTPVFLHLLRSGDRRP